MNANAPTPTVTPATVSTVIKYGDFSFDITSIPLPSLVALSRRGLAHVLGNEAASRAQNAAETVIDDKMKADAGGVAPKDADVTAAYKSQTDEWKSTYKATAVADFQKAILDGTLGIGNSRASTKDPMETAVWAIAKAEVLTLLKANNIKTPKGDEKVKFADGRELGLDDMIESRIEKNSEAIKKEAAKRVAQDKVKAEAARKAAAERGSQGPISSADLGF